MYETRANVGLMKVQAAEIDPKILGEKIDEVAAMDLTPYSHYGKQWAQENNWENYFIYIKF